MALNIISKSDLIKTHEIINQITENFKLEDVYFNLNIDELFRQAYCLPPQQYGLIAEKHFITINGYKKVPSSEDRGDFKNNENEYSEFKTSFLDKHQNFINIRQIRLWQKTNYYYIFTVYFNNEDVEFKLYKLTKKEMEEECILNNANSCHMSEENHSQNKRIELGFTVEVGSNTYKRFEEKYLREGFDLRQLASDRLLQLKTFEERENYYKQLHERNLELEKLNVELFKEVEVEEKKPSKIDIVYFCLDNKTKLPIDCNITARIMFNKKLITFEEIKELLPHLKDDEAKVFEIINAPKKQAKKKQKGIDGLILHIYKEELLERSSVPRKVKILEDGTEEVIQKFNFARISQDSYYGYKLLGFKMGNDIRQYGFNDPKYYAEVRVIRKHPNMTLALACDMEKRKKYRLSQSSFI